MPRATDCVVGCLPLESHVSLRLTTVHAQVSPILGRTMTDDTPPKVYTVGREPVPDERINCRAAALRSAPPWTRRSSLRRRRPRTPPVPAIRRCARPNEPAGAARARRPDVLFPPCSQWHLGIEAHVGVDSRTELTHSIAVKAPTCTTERCWVRCCMVPRPESGVTAPTSTKRSVIRAMVPRAYE